MANSYLSHTTSTPTNSDKATLSFWLKRSLLSSGRGVFAEDTNGTNKFAFILGSNNTISIFQETAGTVDINLVTNRLFRDTSAWYHIVVAYDSSQGSASDRVKLYVNGSQETSFSTSTYPSSNVDFRFNKSGIAQEIGRYEGGNYFDGYLSHVAFVDGQALAPTVFGSTDSTSGIWKFKSPSGVTWGTNGFHLKFENSGNLGLDSSGNSNTFSVNGNGRQALDTPTNSSATMATPTWYNGTIANGGNTVSTNPTNYRYQTSSLGVSKGKWYWEAKLSTAADYALMGITCDPSPINVGTDWILGSGASDYSVVYNNAGGNGNKYNNAGTSPTNTPGAFMGGFAQGDIVMFALDCDNNNLKIGTNNSWSNGTGSTNQTFANTTAISITDPVSTNTGFYFPAVGDYGGGTSVFDLNFGNGYFGTTAITSAGSNGNGSLFEYDVPSGYYALNTKNINTYG